MTTRFLGPLLALVALTGCYTAPSHTEPLDLEWVPPAFETRPVRSIPDDAAMVRLLEPYKAKVDLWRTPIGKSAAELAIVRYECPLNTMIADIARAETTRTTGKSVDMLMLNGGGVRAGLPGGDVSYYDIAQILPFENTIVLIDLDAKNLRPVMEAVAGQKGRTAISGFTLEADAEGKLISFLIDGKEPDPTRTYRFATVDFLANGAGGFEVLKTIPGENTGKLLRDVVADGIRALNAEGKQMEAPADYSRQRYGGLRTEEMTW
jgi:2',3'-cyclic-nucleotide 2'-phosphodiesterase (5'-nucleotidase family)